MGGYDSNSGAKALRARREGKFKQPTTPRMAGSDSDSESDTYPATTPSRTPRSRRDGIHHSAVKTPGSIGLNEQLTSKVMRRLKNSPRSPSGYPTTPSKHSSRSRNTAGQFAQEVNVWDN
ncbi:hypothetical protein FJTKL_07421 [Diaporthe vaccinii]|uniref:Uncharacterized protein n=1 Tax=Diaporthe vaccinii TaxID=105482 RepID=A0ABR4EU18_9PEZI